MHITRDEFGDIDIPGYACGACGSTMMVKNPKNLNLREADFDEVFEEFKNKNF